MMKDTRPFDRRRFARAALTLILALCLCLSVLPAAPASASAQDDALNKLVGWGVMSGYPDGGLHPERALTRAEFVALLNRAYGYKETGSTPFVDVPYTAWYSDDISIAYNAGYFSGATATTAEPNANLTREQAMTLLARSMRLDTIPGEVTEFSDGRSFSTFSRGYVKAAYQKGLVSGYADGSFRPGNNITRGEMAMLLSRALGTLIHEQGEHTLGNVYGNVTINTPGTTLHDTTIVGDLYITGGLGLGSVELDNVRVLGSIIIAGGGESEAGQDSVVLRDVRADELKIDSLAGQYLSVRAEGSTAITQAVVRTDCYIQDRTQAGQGLLGITLEGANGNYTLSGNLEKVANKAPGSSLKISRGTLGSLTIDETAVGSKLTIESDATVKEVNLDTAVNVTGGGDIGSLNVNTAGSSTSMLPDDINIRPGITADVYGETMDTTLGRESSSDPRILAGYPKATDVGPTTMTATAATNKSGTLYWAVSSITDGSVGEQGLLSPASYGSKAVKYGTLQVGESNTDINISVTGLTIGGNYYFSAMLVDARNDHSPVKVISFSTPDNTVPAFASGYPTLTENSYDKTIITSPKKYFAQFTVKSTKSCNLYWAVFTKGSTAPTAAEFRSGALAGAVKNGMEKAERNGDTSVKAEGLNELIDYDIYFWLCDYDGTKSSAVKKLTFKTVDGTPPVFNQTPIPNGQPKATSLSMTTNVNEVATVYWAAVPHGEDYPKPLPNTISMDPHDYYILQVVSGMNAVKYGNVKVKANTDAAINVSGLKAETSYDIWFVAQDTAGNYSVFYTKEDVAGTDLNANFVTVNTLDTSAPIVRQEFSSFDETGRPYPDTDISLIFSEDVLRLSHLGQDDDFSLWSLWEQSLLDDESGKGRAALTAFLRETITLNYYTSENRQAVVDKKDNLVLNYETATVSRASDGKGVVVTFKDARLDSGTYYWFVLSGLADTSMANNPMSPPDYPMEPFITVSSKVILSSGAKITLGNLTSLDLTEIKEENKDKVHLENPGDTSVPIDIAFTMTPEATSREDPTREWDMLIWANISVEYEIYRRELPDGVVDDTPWERLPGDGKINLDTDQTNSGTFLGQTLFKDFDYKRNSNGLVIDENHPIKDLKDDGTIYQYGIHIFSVEDKPTRTSWSRNVTFQFNIVAGSNLRNDLTGYGISEATYNRAIDSGTVDDVTEALRQSLPFQLTKPFEDTLAPSFSKDFPIFTRGDTSLEMTISTDRPATLYWIITPVGSTISAYNQKLAFNPTTDNTEDKNPVTFVDGETTLTDEELAEAIKKAVEDDVLRFSPTKTDLSAPLPASIYRPSPTTNEMIKIGSAPVDTIASPIKITDLAPSTGYFVYLVLKGAGQNSYSDHVMLYKVATTPPDRPVITLNNNTADTLVDVTTTDKEGDGMATTVDYILIPNSSDATRDVTVRNVTPSTTKPEKTGLDSPLYLNCADRDKLPDGYDNNEDYSLLDAMNEYVYEGSRIIGTVFDFYASPEVKNGVADLITGGASGSFGIIVGGGTVTIPTGSIRDPKYTVQVDCSKHNITFGTEYIFLATARNNLTDERGFNSLSPVGQKDDYPPAITNVLPELYLSQENRLSGTITVIFDKSLYYWDASTSRAKLVDTYDTAKGGSRKETGEGIDRLSTSMSTSIKFVKDGYIDEAVSTFRLQLTDAMSGANIVLSSNLCNASGSRRPDASGQITVNLERLTDKATGAVTTQAVVKVSDWNSSFTRTQTVEMDSVELNQATMTLAPSDAGKLTAKVTSLNNTAKTVKWASSNESVATVDSTGLVNALKAGKTTISATTASGASATCTVTVASGTLTLDQTSMTMAVGGIQTLTATAKPASAAGDVTWSSSNDKIATVSTTGIVKAINSGTVNITATATIGGEKVTATCKVTVSAPTLTLPNEFSVPKTGGAILTLNTDLDASLIKDVNWIFTPSNQSAFTIDHDGGPKTEVTVTYWVSGTTNVTIQAKITTVDGAQFTSNRCKLTVAD